MRRLTLAGAAIAVLLFGVFIFRGAAVPSSVAAQGNTSRADAMRLVMLSGEGWRRGGFGNVMLVDFEILNQSAHTVKDVTIVCDAMGQSGTTINRNRRVLYETVKANSSRHFKDFNMGIINTQTSLTSCRVEDMQFVN